ncbi:antibiotic biosynthesis monooxygenase [Allomuricauda sp. d1]|uniref:antibiotic biosynthesis monooxygenase family protein n=1 Tax=Allomuricauda sp. d1 TaxID=3136725 RepID=UPI0031DA2F94
MIIRIFKATIPTALHEEFEIKFKEVSVPVVKNYKGLISLEIGRPTQWNPEEFVMVSQWESEKDLIAFAGENWNQAHIPKGMERYVGECSVTHYESITLSDG